MGKSEFLVIGPENLVFFHLGGKLSLCPVYSCEFRKNGLCWNSDCYELQVCSRKESYLIWKSCNGAIQWMISHDHSRSLIKETGKAMG